MKKIICWSFLVFSLFSCQKKEEQLPLPNEKLVLILSDLHLAEAAFQNLPSSAKDTLAFDYYEQVYQIHQVDKAVVDTAMAILHRNPKMFFSLYEEVKGLLEKKAAESLRNAQKVDKKEKKE